MTKKQESDYHRLKEIERQGHILTKDGLRFIISACEGDPEKIGKHFLEVYANWKS